MKKSKPTKTSKKPKNKSGTKSATVGSTVDYLRRQREKEWEDIQRRGVDKPKKCDMLGNEGWKPR